jgi:integrase
MSELLLDRAGRRRSPATMPGFHARRPPHNKGLRYPADPPKIEEIIAVMRAAGDRPHGRRLRALIVLLWRAGLRIHEALALPEGDLDQRRGSLLIRHGKGGRRREVGLDTWGMGRTPALARAAARASRRRLAVRHQRHHVRAPLVAGCRTRGVAAHGGRGRGSAPLRAAPTAPRPRRRDGTRRRAADRDPAPTRPQQPRDHLRLPARHR